MMSRFSAVRPLPYLALAGALSFLALVPPPALADGARLQPTRIPLAYQQECGSCHLAYPAGLLPARSWRRLMDGLDRHFGTDASLDSPTLRQIGDWLQAQVAGRGRMSAEPAQDRITRSAWFEGEHRKIDPTVWQHASVKSPANCAACHTGAARGDFDDERLRIAPGLDARQRRAFQDNG